MITASIRKRIFVAVLRILFKHSICQEVGEVRNVSPFSKPMIRIHKMIGPFGAKLRWLVFGLMIISISSISFVATMAQGGAQGGDSGDDVDPAEDMRVARISLIQDYVSMQRGDDDTQWFDGTVNSPLQTGDRLFTGDAGRSELQLGSSFF